VTGATPDAAAEGVVSFSCEDLGFDVHRVSESEPDALFAF
jgi:hypothetical protein